MYSEFRDEIVSPVYDSLEELEEDLKSDMLDIDEDFDRNNLIIYRMSPVTSVEIRQHFSLNKK